MEMVRKISTAFLSSGVKLKGLQEERYLGRIYGFAREAERIPTPYGENDKFTGEFVAERAQNGNTPGESGMGSVCFLPSTVSGMLAAALAEEGNMGVKFGFDVYAIPSEKSGTGYEWKIKPLMEVKPSAGLLEFAKDFGAPVASEEKAKEEHEAEGKGHKSGKK